MSLFGCTFVKFSRDRLPAIPAKLSKAILMNAEERERNVNNLPRFAQK